MISEHQWATTGAPFLTVSDASFSKRLKFLLNISATLFKYTLYSSLFDQVLIGFKILESTPFKVLG